MRHQKGKSFISPPRLFRAERALYFPNLRGRTLASPSREEVDTTPVLENKISVVSVFSSTWAERQVATFVSEKHNPELFDVFREGRGKDGIGVQKVDVNVEENTLKAWLIRLFVPSLRRKMPVEQHGKYFVVRRGVSDEIRDAMGLLNSKVGYVYLLDRECRIRWAGSGIALPDERSGLVKGLRRLLDDQRKGRPVGGAASGESSERDTRVNVAAAA